MNFKIKNDEHFTIQKDDFSLNVDELMPLPEYYYGIEWSDDSVPHRIGLTFLHQQLPILSMMKRCMVLDDGTIYGYINPNDYTKYTNGTLVDYTGAHGQCMVEVPEYYYEASVHIEDGKSYNRLKLYPYGTHGRKSKLVYFSAFEGISNDADTTDEIKKLFSICTTNFEVVDDTVLASSITYTEDAVKYRGITYRADDTEDATVKSGLGRPVTQLTIADFRTRAANRGAGWSLQYWDAYMAVVRLYVVEYCSFNSLADFIKDVDANGFKQGGLGTGASSKPSFVSYCHIPCGITKSLVNTTGIINLEWSKTDFETDGGVYNYIQHVPSYRGIENIFGHIGKFTDGINILNVKAVDGGDNNTAYYISDDISTFANDTREGYVLRTFAATNSSVSCISSVIWNSFGDFLPLTVGGSANSGFCDVTYFVTSTNEERWSVLVSGGHSSAGAYCGLFYFWARFHSGNSLTSIGGRLCYTPSGVD